jgi:hypothetical protein
MCHIIKRLSKKTRDEEGTVLILTLVMLAITLAIIPALVSFMVTGAKTGIMYEQKNSELYTADAGVNDAVQLIISSLENNLEPPSDPYLQSEKYGPDINGRDAQVTISSYIKDGIKYYKIFSQGQTKYINQETTITAYINAFDAWGWSHSDNAFTSPETLDFKSGHGGSITGGAQLPQGVTGNGYIDEINYDPILGWPSSSYFIEYYAPQVSDAVGISGGIIDIAKNVEITHGSINQEGDLIIRPQGDGSLTLDNSGAPTVWYIGGDLIVERAASKGTFDINLNGQTMFVEGNIFQETNSGPKIVQFRGPGAVIALGDISFAPAAAVNPDGTVDMQQYIYIASIEGSVNIWPRGEFVGSIHAREASTIQPSTTIIFYEDPDYGGLNIPSGDSSGSGPEIMISGIESWLIDDPSGVDGIQVSPFWLPCADINITYPPQTLSATGGTAPYTWSISSGTLPDGLVLSSSGIIAGTPTNTGKFFFTAQATDNGTPAKVGKQVIVITVNEQPSIITTSLPTGKVGELYSHFIEWQGGSSPLNWYVPPEDLPPGIELLSSTGNFVGNPTSTGTYYFTLVLTDTYGAYDIMPLLITISS